MKDFKLKKSGVWKKILGSHVWEIKRKDVGLTLYKCLICTNSIWAQDNCILNDKYFSFHFSGMETCGEYMMKSVLK